MALAYLDRSRRKPDRTHDAANVSPFGDPDNPQFGIVANQATYGMPEGTSERPPASSPVRGTPGELRSRPGWAMRLPQGSRARAVSEPPAAPYPEPPAAPPMLPPPMPAARDEQLSDHLESDNVEDPVYAWNAERLDSLDQEVYVNIAAHIHSLG